MRNLLEADPDQPAARLCTYPGMVSHLSHEPGYDPRSFFDPAQVELWEKLLVKLKEFELLNLARNQIMPLQREGNDWVFRAGGLNRTWCGQRFMHLSTSTRPLDFMAPWVLDPRVERFGMAYDISSFSQVISMLRRAGQETQDRSYRQLFRFQRQLYRLADGYGLKLEKYLGDGAFFTGRHALQTLLFALRTQRLYREAVDGGFPFDRGMRVGMNFSSYRLIPIEAAKSGGLDRYEFFGHGVVELSRLTTGKATGDVEEVKNWLISRGYPRHAVLRFFEPVAEADLDVVDKELDSHRFYSYINRNGTLINEGIVATREMLRRLDEGLNSPSLYHSRRGGYLYTVVGLEDEAAQCYVGIRKLGVARFKGLDEIPVYELLDGADLEEGFRETEHVGSLLEALDRDFAANLRQNR